MDFMGYDEYIHNFDTDPEDGDDPVIKQLQYNALFDDEEEPDWVIILPGFKPFRCYDVEPVVMPGCHMSRDPGLRQHDQVVNNMREMALKISAKDEKPKKKKRAPRTNRNNPPNQRSMACQTVKFKEPQPQPQINNEIGAAGCSNPKCRKKKARGNGNNKTKKPTKKPTQKRQDPSTLHFTG